MKNILTPINFVLSFVWIFCSHALNGQDTIPLKNPSFEDIPHRGTPLGPSIKMWHDCGLDLFPAETPPDIHPVAKNAWGVSMQPQNGSSYLGLVVRANGTWEAVSQRLFTPLRAEACYSLTAMMALSDSFQSPTIASIKNGINEVESFSHPVKIVIWGGQDDCEKLEILAESSGVANYDWQLYEMILSPKSHCTNITIEAFYLRRNQDRYNGHVLIDNLSPIIEVDCK